MKKNNPARRSGEKNHLAPILSENNSQPGPKTQAPPSEYQMDRALRLTKVKLIPLYQLQNHDKTPIKNARSCKRMFFFETLVFRMLHDTCYIKHALLNLYVYHAFNVC